MTAVSFTVHGLPAPAGSKRGFQRGGRVMVVDDNPNSRAWKAVVLDAAGQAMNGAPLLDGPLLLELTFWLPRPKGHFGKRGLLPSAPPYPIVRPDVLKLARAVEDALTGVVYRDDAQIVTEMLQKSYGEPARCEVRVVPVRSSAIVNGLEARLTGAPLPGREVVETR